jgi:DNA repair ATPase RecN
VPENYTRWLLGHSDTRTVDRYVKPDLQSLKSEYTRLIPHLSIAQVKVKNVTTPEYDSLINKLDEKDAEFEEIKNETEVLKAIVEMYTGKKISELNRLDDKDNDQEPIDIEKVDLQRLKKEITKIGNKVTKS